VAIGAFLTGALLLAVPLIHSTQLTRRAGGVWITGSRAFIAIFFGLVALTLALRDYVSHLLPARQTAGVFFVLAFGVIARGHLRMWRAYWRVAAS
jgi:membrane protein CcdC involved in cytochrome C biogenesis